MILINNKIVNINSKESFVAYLPTSIKLSNLKGWFKLESLSDVVLNFQSQTGTVSTTSGGSTVTGSGTSFGQNDVGKRIRINGEDKWISTVASTTSLTVDSTFSNTNSSVAYSYGYVSKWINSVVGIPDFQQVTTTAQPIIKLINSKLVLYFNLSRDSEYLNTLNDYNLGTKQTYLFKCLNTKSTNVSDIFNSVISSERPRITITSSTKELNAYNLSNSGSNYFLSNCKVVDNLIFSAVNKGTGWEIYNQNNINKTTVANGGSPVNNAVINLRYAIGNYPFATPGVGNSFKGYFSEFIIYDEILTQSEMGKLFHYLNSKKY